MAGTVRKVGMISLLALFVGAEPSQGARRTMMSSSDDIIIQTALQNRQGATKKLSDPSYPSPSFFTQQQDHFDSSNDKTWQQAYYVNDRFWTPGSDAPVFVCVGGEGPPLDGSVVVSSVHCNNAVEWLNQTKALMFAVEHRYYGCHNMSACPVSSFSGKDSLKYLSSRQALADLATFVKFATRTFNLSPSNKWISWGGSYPGMLAGWFRLKYPQLIHGSVASSAPVLAQLDFQGYNDVVASAYSVSDNNVGGSQVCENAIRTGHANIKSMFSTESGRKRLSELFGNSPTFYMSRENQANFAGNGVAYFPAQGNDPSCTEVGCNIKEICKIMVNTDIGDEVTRLAKLRNAQATWVGVPKGTMPQKHSSAKSGEGQQSQDEEPDYWGYQTCTEFGFYQTCEVGTRCFFAQGYDLLSDQADMCEDLYSISIDQVAANINATNTFYGGRSPPGSCILYPNGEVDPWHYNSVLTSPSQGIPVLMVAGASHHAWTHPSSPTDQQSVIAARASIRGTVEDFLSSPCAAP